MPGAYDKLGSMPKRSSTTSTVAKVLAIVLVVLLILIVVAEIALRVFMASQIRSGFEQQAEEDGVAVEEEADVSFGATPLLFGIASGSISQVAIGSPSTLQIEGDSIAGQPATEITLNGLQLDEAMTTDQLTATTEVPEDFLLATIRTQIAENYPSEAGALAEHLTVTDLNANAEANALDVEFVHGAAVLSLSPVESDGELAFEASNTQLFGFDLPPEITSQISDALSQGLVDQATTDGMEIQGFVILDGAVRITITGQDVPLRDISQTTTPPASQPAEQPAA